MGEGSYRRKVLGFARISAFSGSMKHRKFFLDAISFGYPLNPTYGLDFAGKKPSFQEKRDLYRPPYPVG